MLIYTLYFILTGTDLISPLELLALLSGLYIMLYLTAPVPGQRPEVDLPENPGLRDIMLYAWHGQLELKRAFWSFFIILNIALLIDDFLVTHGLFSVSSWQDVLIMLACASILWIVSVWRCSALTESRIWSAFARFATLGAVADFALRIFIWAEYPREFFQCQEVLLDYSSCF